MENPETSTAIAQSATAFNPDRIAALIDALGKQKYRVGETSYTLAQPNILRFKQALDALGIRSLNDLAMRELEIDLMLESDFAERIEQVETLEGVQDEVIQNSNRAAQREAFLQAVLEKGTDGEAFAGNGALLVAMKSDFFLWWRCINKQRSA